MTRDEQIRRDLGIKLSGAIEQLLDREIKVARCVLPVSHVVELLLDTAMGINTCVVSVALQARSPGVDPGECYDDLVRALSASLARQKPRVLDGVALIDAGRVDEAVSRYGSGRRP